jgi:hemoglobin
MAQAPYRSTPVFDETSLPQALRREHQTKAGVWGVIRVLEGRLGLTVLDPPSQQLLTPTRPGLVLPQQPHRVAPLGRMRMQVDFYDSPPPEDLTPASRRAGLVSARMDEIGIDEAMIRRLVHRFYGDVRADPLLGPIFEARIADWDAHLAKLCDFWSSIALMTGRFHGRPMQAHLPLPIVAGHFERWLALFRTAAAEVCPPPASAFFVERAERIAESLQLGIACANGRIAGHHA